MNSKIIRKIDELGRIVIPKNMREELNLHPEDDVVIALKNNCIVLNKSEGGNNAQYKN